MNWFGNLLGSTAGSGAAEVLKGVSDAAVGLRTAFTGDLPPEAKVKLSEFDTLIAIAQNKVNEIEAASASLFVAGWRPAAGWSAVMGLYYNFIFQPLLSWFSVNMGWVSPPVIDIGALITLLLGMLGLGAMRSYEKVMDVNNKH